MRMCNWFKTEKRINLDSEVALFLLSTKWDSDYAITHVLARMFDIIETVAITNELKNRKLIAIKDKNHGNTLYEVTLLGKTYLESYLKDISINAIVHYKKNIEFTAIVFSNSKK